MAHGKGRVFLSDFTPHSGNAMSTSMLRLLSNVCFVAGFGSIVASIAIWTLMREPDPTHAERLGIFVGLWAPTFFALSDRFDRYATQRPLTA